MNEFLTGKMANLAGSEMEGRKRVMKHFIASTNTTDVGKRDYKDVASDFVAHQLDFGSKGPIVKT